MHDFLPNATPLSAAELDHRLEKAVQDHERAEKLICFLPLPDQPPPPLPRLWLREYLRLRDGALQLLSFQDAHAPVPRAQAHSATAAHRGARRRQDRLDQSREGRIAGESRD